MTKKKWLLLIAGVVVVGLPAAILAFLRFLDLPPAPWVQLPNGAYDESRLKSKELALSSLAARYRGSSTTTTDENCKRQIEEIVGDSPSPEDLALFAIWAEHSDPWLSSNNLVYSNLFYGNIGALARLKNDARAVYALWKVREWLVSNHHWDGHLAESIEAAEHKQRAEK